MGGKRFIAARSLPLPLALALPLPLPFGSATSFSHKELALILYPYKSNYLPILRISSMYASYSSVPAGTVNMFQMMLRKMQENL